MAIILAACEFEFLRLRFYEISKGQTKRALLRNVFLKQGSLLFVRATRPSKDTFQSLEIVKDFVDKFNCVLTLSENSEHPFMGEGDEAVVQQWLQDNL